MKRKILQLILVLTTTTLFAQTYEFVIIPDKIIDFKAESNAYNINSTLKHYLIKKNIKVYSDLEAERMSYEDKCKGVKAVVKNTSSLFKNKLTLDLVDCNNITVWGKQGVGKSKEFQPGYTEAITDIMSDFTTLPNNQTLTEKQVIIATTENTPQLSKPIEVSDKVLIQSAANTTTATNYKIQNQYDNPTYQVDFIEENGTKVFKIINATLLGYKSYQTICTFSPSGIDGIYNTNFLTPTGTIHNGIATVAEKEIKISLDIDNKKQVLLFTKH